MKRRSRVLRTSSRQETISSNKTLMLEEFKKSILETSIENHQEHETLWFKSRISALSIFFMTSSSMFKRFSRRESLVKSSFSQEKKESFNTNVRDKQSENHNTKYWKNSEQLKFSKNELIINVELYQAQYSKQSYNRNVVIILMIKNRKVLN
jgi:hypothetical protein